MAKPLRTVASSQRWVIALITLLITYGSVYPLSFSLSAGDALAWQRFFTEFRGNSSVGDLVGNIALFLPLGFFTVVGAQRTARTRARLISAMLQATLFALVLQLVQIYLPDRSAALADVFWNAVGMAIGLGAGVTAAVNLDLSRFRGKPFATLPAAVAALWAINELTPLVPSLDVQQFFDSLKPLLLDRRFSATDTFSAAVSVCILGMAIEKLTRAYSSVVLLGIGAGLTLAAKPFIVALHLDVSTVAGFLAGWCGWLALRRSEERQRAVILFAALLLSLTVERLAPFRLAPWSNPVQWLPFADALDGSMLNNARSLASKMFVYVSIFWLATMRGGSLRLVVLALAIWIGLLECAQLFLAGRSPSVTEPLWVLIAGLAFSTLARLSDEQADDAPTPAPLPKQSHPELPAPGWPAPGRPAPGRPAPGRPIPEPYRDGTSGRRAALGLLLAALVGGIPLWAALRLPGVPYNLRELLHGDGSILACWILALAVLSCGAGAAWVAGRLQVARWPVLALPAAAFAVAMISLLLLYLSVTEESIGDISGSNNLYWFVTNKGIWGEYGHWLFLEHLKPTLVSFVERCVRFAALYSPLVILIAIAQLTWWHRADPRQAAVTAAWFLLNAIPWLILCKAIAFDWSSTDNLNELIARDGAFGLGGGALLYGLMILLAVNVVATAHCRSALQVGLAVGLTALCLPMSWWLLNQGLEAEVKKYELTYSGVQFLLGPDRQTLLGEAALFGRWLAVYTAAVLALAVGVRLGASLFAPQRSATHATAANRSQSTSPPGSTEDSAAIHPVLSTEQLELINELAQRLRLDIQSTVQRIVDQVLQDHSEQTLARGLAGGGSHGQEAEADPPPLELQMPAQQLARLLAVAEQAEVSPSRVVRHSVELFFAELEQEGTDNSGT